MVDLSSLPDTEIRASVVGVARMWLRCDICDDYLCDLREGDSLEVLLGLWFTHVRSCPMLRSSRALVGPVTAKFNKYSRPVEIVELPEFMEETTT